MVRSASASEPVSLVMATSAGDFLGDFFLVAFFLGVSASTTVSGSTVGSVATGVLSLSFTLLASATSCAITSSPTHDSTTLVLLGRPRPRLGPSVSFLAAFSAEGGRPRFALTASKTAEGTLSPHFLHSLVTSSGEMLFFSMKFP